ncbi:MAG TPA: hypothetical protein VMI33_21545 [Streptosporangiaceae bacterium]|nr:hypothetical protein [Streptosporangiaceae bacterium]
MTGSALVPIIVPIVAVLALAAWLTLVYWADAHPASGRHVAEISPPAAAGAEAAAPGGHEPGEEEVPARPVRRAA